MNYKNSEGSLSLGTNKFQKKTNRWKITISQRKFIHNNLVDKKKLKLKKDIVTTRNSKEFCINKINCKLSQNSVELFTKDFFQYNKCKKCDLVYVQKVIKEEKLLKLYKNSKYSNSWGKTLNNITESSFNYFKFKEALKNLNKFTKPGKILDVGCATGQFLDVSKEFGWDTSGIELNDYERKISQKKGHEIYKYKIEKNYLPKNHYDAVAILETLEHVYSPNKVLKSIYKVLKKNGYLLIIVPNVDSLAAKIMQSRCNMFLGMSHITMYSPDTLKKQLQNHGFHQVFIKTITSEYSVINNYLSMDDPYLGTTNKKNFILKKFSPNNIIKKNLGYKIKAIFKKNK